MNSYPSLLISVEFVFVVRVRAVRNALGSLSRLANYFCRARAVPIYARGPVP